MTCTNTVAELTAAAARESALGNHNYASHLYLQAYDNSHVAALLQDASRQGIGATTQAITPALVGYDTGTLHTTQTSYATSATTETNASRVQSLKGHDGTQLTD